MGKSKNRAGEARNMGEEEKKEEGVIEAVFKLNMRCACDGCARKIVQSVLNFDGVKEAKSNSRNNKIKVVGKVDLLKLLEKIKMETNEEVELELPSTLPKKGRKVVLRIQVCWCHYHADMVEKIVSKTVGVQSHAIDKERSLVTVKGTMDVNALTETLKKKMEKDVEVISDRAPVGENKKELPAVVENADQPKLEKTRDEQKASARTSDEKDEKTRREQKKRENTKTSGRKEKKTRHEPKDTTPNEPPVTNAVVKSKICKDVDEIGLTVSNAVGVHCQSTDPGVNLEMEAGRIQEEDGSPPPRKKKGRGAWINLSFHFNVTNNFSLVHVL